MKEIRDLLKGLYIRKIIGQKHIPEGRAKRALKWLNKRERKEFEKEYNQLVKNEIFLKRKKQTGKGTGWHISLNPRKVKEVEEMLQ